MKTRRLMWGLGGVLVFFSLAFLVPTIIAFFYDQDHGLAAYPVEVPSTAWGFVVPETALVYLAAGTIVASLGLLLQYFGEEGEDLRTREAYAIVGLGWLLVAALGAIPYIALGALPHPVDALYESMSGFSTTGSTVFLSVDGVAPSLLFWRSFTQWIGAGGIIVLAVALLAGLTQGGNQLMSAESSGIRGERLRPKIAQTAKVLWSVYVSITALITVMYVVAMHTTGIRLPLKAAFFDGLAHALTTVATGGFSTHDASMAYFASGWVDAISVVGMILGGLSFPLMYLSILDRSPARIARDAETRFFLAVAALVALFLAWTLWRADWSAGAALQAGVVQGVSVITTTGYTPYFFDEWPDAARLVLLFMFFTGASTGSTTGAMKAVRILVLFKLVIRELRRLLHPRAVIPLRLGKKVLSDDTIKSVTVFFFTYITIVIAGTMLLTVLGLDMVSAAGAAASAIGNIGPGMGSTFANVAEVPVVGKLALIFMMWAGRLEIFTVLILFSRETWRR